MVHLFLSYSRQDKELADDLEQWLRDRGCEVFLDVGVEDGIAVGSEWEEAIYQALKDADGIVVLVTKSSIESKWCFAEITIARLLGKEILPVMGEAEAVHPLLSGISHANFATERQRADTRLTRELETLATDAKLRYDGKRPPFPGLNHFDVEDAAVFFGRTAETKRLQERLQKPRPPHRFVPVVGSSGSGKSSLVRAGLMPKLARRSEWILAPVIYPDESPMTVLAQAIRQTWRQEVAGETPPSAVELQRRIEQDFSGLTQDLIHRAGGDRRFLLITIDQFEELFTSRSVEERASLLQCLGEIVSERPGSVWCVVTMRAEFLGEALATEQHKLFDDPLLLPALARSALPEIIQGPARAAGLKLGAGLVEQMIADTSGGDALPLLAYTLQQLSDGLVRGDTLRLEQYNNQGGVAGALQSKADETLQALLNGSVSRDRVLETLCKLVTVDDEERAARLRVPLERFTADERSILDRFVDTRLLVTAADGPEETVAVAHEALIRQWQPLTSAVAARRDQIRLEQTLQRTAKEWSCRNRPSVIYSWRGSRLQEAAQWLSRQTNPPQEVADFIAASLEESNADRSREADLLARRVDKECQREREKALLLLLAAADHYVATPRVLELLGTFADKSRLRARIPSDAMPLQDVCYTDFTAAGISPDGRTVFTADAGTIPRRRPTTRLATKPLPQEPVDPWTWLRAWDWTTPRELWRRRLEVSGIQHLRTSQDGDRLLLVPVRGSTGVYRTGDGELETLLAQDQDVVDARFMNDGRRAVTLDESGRLQVWDLETGQVVQALDDVPPGNLRIASDDSVATVQSRDRFSWITLSDKMTVESDSGDNADGILHTTIVDSAPPLQLAVIDRNLIVSDRENSTSQTYPFNESILDAFFCDCGNRVIVVDRNRVVVLRVARDSELELTVVAEVVVESRGCVVSRDGSVLLTHTPGEVLIWNGRDRETDCPAQQLGRPVQWARRLDDGRLATCTTEHVRIHAPNSQQLLREKILENRTQFARLSADGHLLVAANHDVTIYRMDDSSSPGIVLAPTGSITGLAISARGDRIVTSHYTHIAVWDGKTGEQLTILGEHEDEEGDTYSNVDISPNGRFVAAGTQAGTRSRIFDTRSGQPSHTIAGDFVRFSPDGRLLLTNLNERTSVIDVESGEAICQLSGAYDLTGGDVSPDGQLAVVVDNSRSNGSALVYRLSDGGCLANLEHPGFVNDACFSLDGGTIVTACEDGSVRFWRTPQPAAIVARARSRVFRQLTAAERREFGLPTEPAPRGL